LPSDWPKRRLATKARAKGLCEAEVHEPDCDGFGAECDHHIANDDHSLSNLRWLSAECHAAKTRREARAALLQRKATTKLPRERHPSARNA
jgi:5-methylcytosine-specific restriction protein A